jgi:hypothetical protein
VIVRELSTIPVEDGMTDPETSVVFRSAVDLFRPNVLKPKNINYYSINICTCNRFVHY